MNTLKKLLWLPFIVCFMIFPPFSSPIETRAEGGEEEGPILIGHISHVEGKLFRYDPDGKDWVATFKDAPWGKHDTVYTDEHGRAEFLMPNNTWVRINGDTQIQLLELEDNLTEVDLASGVARFYNKGSGAVVKAITFYGYVMAPEETSFDVYVDDHSVEIIALKGTVSFFHRTTGTKYEVIAGSSSIRADRRQVRAGEGLGDHAWNSWNQERDHLWAKRRALQGESVTYLPPRLYDEAYVLEDHGRWQRVYYDGAYRIFWRPVYVGAGWSPFTVGRWMMWCGHHTWIPYEPFGYITHHYGNWVVVGGFWYWAPPVTWITFQRYPSLLNVGFAWYPGRVAWIHHHDYVGWIPLAPFEPYYCYRRWGPHTVVVNNVNITNITINREQYRYVNHAVVINRNNFYHVSNYQNVRIWNAHNIINSDRVAPVLSDTVIKSSTTMREGFRFTQSNGAEKAARFFTPSITQHEPLVTPTVTLSAKPIQQSSTAVKPNSFYDGHQGVTEHTTDHSPSVTKISGPVSGFTFEEKGPSTNVWTRTKEYGQERSKITKELTVLPPKPLSVPSVPAEAQGLTQSQLPKLNGNLRVSPEQQNHPTYQNKLEQARQELGKTWVGQQVQQGQLEKPGKTGTARTEQYLGGGSSQPTFLTPPKASTLPSGISPSSGRPGMWGKP